MIVASSSPRIGIVLSAGGLRGAAHLGVLRRVLRYRIPVHVMVGVSAGAIIAAYYAAVGLSVTEMIDDAPTFRGRHIIMHGVTLRAPRPLKRYLHRFCGVIPERLAQLDAASFETLHHGIEHLGIVCHDLVGNRPVYFSTGSPLGIRFADVVRASAAVPGVMPPRAMTVAGESLLLADGGISDSLPIAFAKSVLGATHVIASDCRATVPAPPPRNDTVIYIRPKLDGIRTLRAPRAALMTAVDQGEAAVTPDLSQRIREWRDARWPVSVLTSS